jgi:hypothetical protein
VALELASEPSVRNGVEKDFRIFFWVWWVGHQFLSLPVRTLVRMHIVDPVELMKGFRRVDLGVATPFVLQGLLADVRRVRARLDLVEAEVSRRVGATSATPERDVARGARRHERYGAKVRARAKAVGSTPELAAALESGLLGGEHVDVYVKALGAQDAKVRAGLEAQAGELVAAAVRDEATPEEFALQLCAAADGVAGDLGVGRFERQRRATRLRTWTDRGSGMWCLSGRFDPVSGAVLHGRLQASMAAMFALKVPSTAPEDVGERQDHLRALALLALTAGYTGAVGASAARAPASSAPTSGLVPTPTAGETVPADEEPAEQGAGEGRYEKAEGAASTDRLVLGSEVGIGDVPSPPRPHDGDSAADASGVDEWDGLAERLGGRVARFGRPELVVVINANRLDANGRPTVEIGLPVSVPWGAVVGLAKRARVYPVVVDNGNVVGAVGELDVGRSARVANKAQRRVLQALYSACAMPGCEVDIRYTKPHHVWWWRHGGPTDLWNLCPLCQRCHDNVHHRGWVLSLGPNRELTVELPDGKVMSTGPPSLTKAG